MNALRRIYENEDAVVLMISKYRAKDLFTFKDLADYGSKLLKGLTDDIDAKSKGYKKSALSNIFILNNSHYVLKYIKGTKVTESIDKNILSDIEKTMKKQLNLYSETWLPILNHLVDQIKINENHRIVTTLAKQQKDTIKASFTVFIYILILEF
jgi:hypothetical protein